MRLTDLAFWRSDEEKFADLVQRSLIAAGETRSIRFDKSDFALRIGESEKAGQPEILYLQNFFAQYSSVPEAERPHVLERIIASCAESHESLYRETSRPRPTVSCPKFGQ